jgi:hypothetical protein
MSTPTAAASVIEVAWMGEDNVPAVHLRLTLTQPPARVCATTTPPTDPADLAAYDAGRTAIADAVCAGLAAALAAGQLDGLPS